MKRVLVAGAFLLGLSALAQPAQAQTGTARGKVLDDKGQPIEGAKVLIEFQGGITRLQFDPNAAGTVYAGVLGYGAWRSIDGGITWKQIFQTMNPAELIHHGHWI